MIHVSAQHKVIGVPAIPAVTTLFPEARRVNFDNRPTVLLPHGLKEVQVLRGLGFANVPAPVLTQYEWPHPPGQPPYHVQKLTVAMLTTERRGYNLNDMGCVDADTEYLSPTGWVRIADYQAGKVAQYHPDTGAISFVEPTQYVKLPCAEMIRFKTTRGVDQLLSPEHRVLLANGNVVQAEDVEMVYGPRTRHELKFKTTFRVEGTEGIALSDIQIRLQVAVNADGYKPHDSHKVVIRLKRARKIERMRWLLAAAGVAYKETDCQPTGFKRFSFVPPMAKGFDTSWWMATQEQLYVIADEATHWDGCFRKADAQAFSSYVKGDADFIQYAYSAAGRRASLATRTRHRRGATETDYVVHACAGNSDVGLYGVDANGPRQNVTREPSTDGFKYCFMVPTTFLLLRRNGCVFATGNTGKTRCTLWAFDFLRRQGLARKLLVVAPISTLEFTWKGEIFRCFPHLSATVLHHTNRNKRVERLAQDHDVYITNHDGLLVLEKELLARTDIDCIAIDELAVFRNARGRKNAAAQKLAQRLGDGKGWFWGMTGSPTPEEPTDAYGQCKIITPHSVPKRFTHFREATMTKVTQFKWTPRHDHQEVVHRAMQPAVRFTIDDIVELPELVEQYVDVPMGKEQHRIYEELRKEAFSLVERQEITGENAGAVLNKMLQVSLGYVYVEGATERETKVLDNHARLDRLIDDIRACRNKIIVFAPFRHAIAGISERLTQENLPHGKIDGSTPARLRSELFNRFQNTDQPRIIVAHPGTMSHGVTLTAADTICWFGPINSYETFEQANRRIRRIGQKRKQLILMYQATKAERNTYANLRTKGKVQDGVLAMFLRNDL